jgi:hypothetical protein
MPTIKTIKPGGGGDYTLLQTWEDFADGEATADQWAECYDGGDLGEVVISGWSSTPTAVIYPRIYTPLAERHNARDDGTGAFISSTTGNSIVNYVNYVQIDGIRMESTSTANSIISMVTSDGVIVENNLLIQKSYANTANAIYIVDSNPVSKTCDIQNNIVFGNGLLATGILILGIATTNPVETDSNIFNNTIIDVTSYGITGTKTETSDTVTLNVVLRNNICGEGGLLDINWTNFDSIVSTNNITSDGTSDDNGGEGNLVNKPGSSQLINRNTHARLLSSGEARDGGVALGSFSTDALGTTRVAGGNVGTPVGLLLSLTFSGTWDAGSVVQESFVLPRGPGISSDPILIF